MANVALTGRALLYFGLFALSAVAGLSVLVTAVVRRSPTELLGVPSAALLGAWSYMRLRPTWANQRLSVWAAGLLTAISFACIGAQSDRRPVGAAIGFTVGMALWLPEIVRPARPPGSCAAPQRPRGGHRRRSRRPGAPPRRQPGAGGRGGHPPPAPGHRRGHHLLRPRGETGLLNVIVSPGCWAAFRRAARGAAALVVQGRLERKETVVNIVAEKLEELDLRVALTDASGPLVPKSRDFR